MMLIANVLTPDYKFRVLFVIGDWFLTGYKWKRKLKFLSFFLSFLVWTPVYLLTQGIAVIVVLNLIQLHTHTHTLGRTSLDEGSASRKELYLITHNTHNRETALLPRDSNPQSQQYSGLRTTLWAARPLVSAILSYYESICYNWNCTCVRVI